MKFIKKYFHCCLDEKKIISINKFSKHNLMNVSFCKIKYLDLHLPLDLCNFDFSYC